MIGKLPKVNRLKTALAAACGLVAVIVALATLRSAWCAFSNKLFRLVDYGLYAGAMWNTAHGRVLQILDGENYVSRHLSFSLVPLSAIFWVTDHPFVLSFFQWALAVAGAGLLFAGARRQGAGAPSASALALFYLLLPMTQGALLAEFHGMTLLLFALPWLYFTAVTRPAWTWLPLVFTCGLREESGLLAAVTLFALARPLRSMRLVWMGVAAVAYVGFALLVLFPWLNEGTSIFVRRPEIEQGTQWALLFSPKVLRWRAVPSLAAISLLLPLMLLRPGRFALLSALPLLTCYLSSQPRQLAITLHYAAPFVAAMGVCVAMTLGEAARGWRRWVRIALPIWLVGAAVISHVTRGFFWPSVSAMKIYQRTSPEARAVVEVAAQIPREGLLVCDDVLAGFCSARERILNMRMWAASGRTDFPDFVFLRKASLESDEAGWVKEALSAGRARIVLDEDGFVVVEKGGRASLRNAGDAAPAKVEAIALLRR